MPSIYELRKFLVSERFVILKGDYVGHEFHGNQYSDLSVFDHDDRASKCGKRVSDLQSEGRRRTGRHRNHGYSLDGEIATNAMDAIDHKVASQKGLVAFKAEVKALAEKIVAAGMQLGDWPVHQQDPSKKELLREYQEKERGLQKLDSPFIRANWGSRKNHTVSSLSKDAATALNRGYKEVVTGLVVAGKIAPPKAKSLLDNKNQPRPEALAIIVNDVKRINDAYKAAAKTAQDEKTEPIERYLALASLTSKAKAAKEANDFLTSVYRIAGDSTNELASSKVSQKCSDGLVLSENYFSSDGLKIASAASRAYLDKAESLVNIRTFDITAPTAKANAEEAEKQALNAWDAANIASNAAKGYREGQLIVSPVTRILKSYEAIKLDVVANEALENLKAAMGDLGKGSLDKIVIGANGLSENPENLSNALEAYEDYKDVVGKNNDAMSAWKSVESSEDPYPDVAKKTIEQYQKNAPSLKNMGIKIADAHLVIGRQMMDYIRKNADSDDPETVKKANLYLSYVSKCSSVGTSLYGEKSNSSYWAPTVASQGFEDKFNESSRLGTESSVFSDLITGKNKALIAIEDSKSLPEVDTKDINKSDPDSYMYKSGSVMDSLNEAISYFNSARSVVSKSALSDADKKNIYDSINKIANQTESTLKTLNSGFSKKVVDSALKNGDAEVANAEDPNADNPMYAWHNAFEQYKLARDNITKQIDSANEQGSDAKELQKLRDSVILKMEKARIRNNSYQRERQYAL